MIRRLLIVVSLLVLVSGCATVRTEGVSGPVAWRTTDFKLTEDRQDNLEGLSYFFALVLKETTGVGITFTRVEFALYEGTGSEQTGSWRLPPNGELRFPASSFHICTDDFGAVASVDT